MPTSKPEKKEPKKPLSITHPELAKEADGWDPTTDSLISHKKVSWKCKSGHSWEASFNNRSRHNSGCPFCSNRKVFKGFNDLQTVRPDLALEADGWDPGIVLSGSHKKVSWLCVKAGHKFVTKIENRTLKGTGCPVCLNQTVLEGFNDLETTHPRIAKDAHGWNPRQVMASSNHKREWKCPSGHIQTKSPRSRTKTIMGCTICSGRTLSSGINDFATTHPDLALEAFNWNPATETFGSSRIVNWKCTNDHIWNAKISSRTSSPNSRCPVCQNLKLEVGVNDLATTHPGIASQALDWDSTSVTASNSSKFKWICPKGHVEVNSVKSRINSVQPCGVCAKRSVIAGENDLLTTHPEVGVEADGWDPTKFHSGSAVKKNWKCKQGHVWRTEIRSRADRSSGCPYCTNVLVASGENDLATLFPEIAKQASGWDPTLIHPGSHKQKMWVCVLGHQWRTSVDTRTVLNTNCPVCANQQVLSGFNDFLHDYPELSKEADGWDPSKVISGTKKKYPWRCKLGHTWNASPGVRGSAGTGCPTCAFNLLLTGFNDLQTTFPELAKEADGWDPSKVVSGGFKKYKWKCAEGHIWLALISSRKNGRGCPYCSATGFNPGSSGWLYFLEHSNWEMLQIGITNFPDQRLNKHKKLGWEVLELRGPMDGHLTQQWESAILRMLKKKGADLSNEKIAGKFDGYSEAWTKASFPVDSIKELMRLTDEYEENLGKRGVGKGSSSGQVEVIPHNE